MVDIVRAIFNKYHFSLIRWINAILGIASLILAKAVLRPYFDLLRREGLFQKYIDTTQLYYQE